MNDREKNIEDMNREDLEVRIQEIESKMGDAAFWEDKKRSDDAMSELNHLKSQLSKNKSQEVNYDEYEAIMTIFSGAGGDDAEDFARMLLEMYQGYIQAKGWKTEPIHQNMNEHGGYKNVSIEIRAKGAYGTLKNESGVHRLVRISPFNANKQRHTAFAMVEVIPKFKTPSEFQLPEDEITVEFARSSGPGGQNVNKRETAVRITHTPTGISVHVDGERTQHANREHARQLLAGKLHRRLEQERQEKEEGMYVSKTTDAEWGSQIRSYVLHPYQMVKDHRTGVELRDVDNVLGGDIQPFIDAGKG
ncbi:MAG: PCRF domain-containing protein [Candidatus Paceibacterota bacterium]